MNRHKKIVSLILIFILAGSLVAGCSKGEDGSPGFQVYYLNIDKTKLAPREYELISDTKDVDKAACELMEVISTDSGDVKYKRSIPNGITYRVNVENEVLNVYLDASYMNLSITEDVLCRASIVRTLTQLDGINAVNFYAGESPLVDANGELVGVMTNDSFVENPGEQINAIQEVELTLYFADSDGNGLVAEKRTVHYSTNIAIEKLVVEQLLKGPEMSGALASIPSGTKIVNVSVVDNVCFVSLDEGFTNQNYEIQEAVVIYSIVDSLTELKSVKQVQISVNGDTNRTYRDTFTLNTMYERNTDIIDVY